MADEKTMKDSLLPAFSNATLQAFETMVFMPVSAGEAANKVDGNPTGAMSGTIGISGEDICGSLALIFSKELIESIFRSMMMMGPDDAIEETELKDAVGELANMVAGGAKAALQDSGINFVIGLPTVIVGVDHHLDTPGTATSLVVPMTVDAGTFYMEVSAS